MIDQARVEYVDEHASYTQFCITESATIRDIEKQYRIFARKVHPDAILNPTALEIVLRTEQFKKLQPMKELLISHAKIRAEKAEKEEKEKLCPKKSKPGDQEYQHGFALRLFNPKKPSDIKLLNAFIDAEIARAERENKPLNLTHAKMVEWLKKYVNSPDFLKSYSDQRSLELVAEATFWSVNLGLELLLAKMSYAEIRKFKPLSERLFDTTERTRFINEVCNKLTMPAMSHEVSYALGQAAWCVYIHKNSFEKLQEDQKLYESNTTKPRL